MEALIPPWTGWKNGCAGTNAGLKVMAKAPKVQRNISRARVLTMCLTPGVWGITLDGAESGGEAPAVIAEAPARVRAMSVSDAVMQLDLAEQAFLVFRNASHGGINVVYRRPDGNIGWIDPSGVVAGAKP